MTTTQIPLPILHVYKCEDNANMLNCSISSLSSSTGCLHRMHHCSYYPTWLSVFCCCCPLLGCVSLYLTRRSEQLKLSQKHVLADKYSSIAEKLNIAALIIGVILYACAVFIITLLIFMYWRHEHRS